MTDYNFGTLKTRNDESAEKTVALPSPSDNTFIYTVGKGEGYQGMGFSVSTDSKITFTSDADPDNLRTLDKALAAKLGWVSDGAGGFRNPSNSDPVLLPGSYVYSELAYEAFVGHNESISFTLQQAPSGGSQPTGPTQPTGTATFVPKIVGINGSSEVQIVKPGQFITVQATVTNTGTVSGDPGASIFSIEGNGISRYLDTLPVTAKVGPGERYDEGDGLTLPSDLKPGQRYYIQMTVNGVKSEIFPFQAAPAQTAAQAAAGPGPVSQALFNSGDADVDDMVSAIAGGQAGSSTPVRSLQKTLADEPDLFDAARSTMAEQDSVQALARAIVAGEGDTLASGSHLGATLLSDAIHGAIGRGMITAALAPEVSVLGGVIAASVGTALIVGAVADAIDQVTGTTDIVGFLKSHTYVAFQRVEATLGQTAN